MFWVEICELEIESCGTKTISGYFLLGKCNQFIFAFLIYGYQRSLTFVFLDKQTNTITKFILLFKTISTLLSALLDCKNFPAKGTLIFLDLISHQHLLVEETKSADWTSKELEELARKTAARVKTLFKDSQNTKTILWTTKESILLLEMASEGTLS